MSNLQDEVADALECSCYQCLSGDEVDMADWMENPLHLSLHDQVRAAMDCGHIHTLGEDDEDAESME